MIFSLVIHSSPSSQTSITAYRFAETLLRNDHKLHRVFFYHDGVYQGLSIHTLWQALQQEYQLDLIICIAAGVKRGVLDTAEAKRQGFSVATLANGLALSGLGQLADATVYSDRVITFGG